MREILVAGGLKALVSDPDYARLSQFKWFMAKGSGDYVARNVPTRAKAGRRWVNVFMHHEILPYPWFGFTVDHADGNPLNNQRENLRYATPQQQSWNTRVKKRGSSRYRGVYRDDVRGKWRAEILHLGKNLRLGWFDQEVDAARAWNTAALKYRGAFAKLNVT